MYICVKIFACNINNFPLTFLIKAEKYHVVNLKNILTLLNLMFLIQTTYNNKETFPFL